MRLIPSDPDVETIVGRIRDRSLELQPEFQRGSVWSRPKQRLLVDSILRNWYVPPVHVVRTESEDQVVLDGQQRLTAIYEFVENAFPIDGSAEPADDLIRSLGGIYYRKLPETIKKRFDRFTVRVFEVVDYEPEEPWELFYRLNSPMPLTSAEKRNAFFGSARAQIAELASSAQNWGMSKERLGFSNNRLAYEDVIARFVWTLEQGTLDDKVTAGKVTERYRQAEGFRDEILEWASASLRAFLLLDALDRPEVSPNRAMLHSWLCFVARSLRRNVDLFDLDEFVTVIEGDRLELKGRDAESLLDGRTTRFLAVLNDRAASRVNDASSVILRDVVLWILYASMYGIRVPELEKIRRKSEGDFESTREFERVLLSATELAEWGALR